MRVRLAFLLVALVALAHRLFAFRIAEALALRGFRVLPSLANFVTFDTGVPGRDVWKRLLARGVIVRPLDPYDMKSWLRVSVGTPPENAAFLAALDAVLPGKRS